MVFSFASFLFCLLTEYIIVTAFTHVSVKALIGVVAIYNVTAPFASYQLLICAFGASVNTCSLAECSLRFRQFFAAEFTCYSFHKVIYDLFIYHLVIYLVIESFDSFHNRYNKGSLNFQTLSRLLKLRTLKDRHSFFSRSK